MLSLRELKARFFEVPPRNGGQTGIAAAGAATIDPGLLGLVRGYGALGPAERLGSGDMYRARR